MKKIIFLIMMIILSSFVLGDLTDAILFYNYDTPSAKDVSGNARNGTLVNSPTYSAAGGVIGGFYNCSGTNDYIDTSYTPSELAGSFSVSFWFNTLDGSLAGLWGSYNGNEALQLSHSNSVAGKYYFWWRNNPKTETLTNDGVGIGNLNNGAWHHTVITRNFIQAAIATLPNRLKFPAFPLTAQFTENKTILV